MNFYIHEILVGVSCKRIEPFHYSVDGQKSWTLSITLFSNDRLIKFA